MTRPNGAAGQKGEHVVEIKSCVALVTGGASGLGQATVENIVAGGGRAVILDREGSPGPDLAKKLGDRVALRRRGRHQHGAGAGRDRRDRRGLRHDQRRDQLRGRRRRGEDREQARAVSARAVHASASRSTSSARSTCIRLAAEAMSKNEPNEDGERGVIVNTASVAAFEGQIGQAAYSASKGGVVGMTLPIARDLAQPGSASCTIAPGIFDTPMLAMLPEEGRRARCAGAVPVAPRRSGRVRRAGAPIVEIGCSTARPSGSTARSACSRVEARLAPGPSLALLLASAAAPQPLPDADSPGRSPTRSSAVSAIRRTSRRCSPAAMWKVQMTRMAEMRARRGMPPLTAGRGEADPRILDVARGLKWRPEGQRVMDIKRVGDAAERVRADLLAVPLVAGAATSRELAALDAATGGKLLREIRKRSADPAKQGTVSLYQTHGDLRADVIAVIGVGRDRVRARSRARCLAPLRRSGGRGGRGVRVRRRWRCRSASARAGAGAVDGRRRGRRGRAARGVPDRGLQDRAARLSRRTLHDRRRAAVARGDTAPPRAPRRWPTRRASRAT